MVEEAIASILGQTWEDWELIVIDDASDTMLSNTLSQQLTGDGRLQLIRNDGHLGVGASRNRGVSLATGEWLMFLDDDDMIESEALAKAAVHLEGLGASGALALPCRMHPDSDKKRWGFHSMKTTVTQNRKIPERSLRNFHLLIETPPQISSLICRRQIIAQHPFDTDIHYGEDLLVWAAVLKAGLRVTLLSDVGKGHVLIRHHGHRHLSEKSEGQVIRYFDELADRFGPLDARSIGRMQAKLFLRALVERNYKELGKVLGGAIKKPRYFLGSFLFQLLLKCKTLGSLLFYRVFRI